MNQCLSDLRSNIKKQTNESEKIDNKMNQVNLEAYELKKQIDQRVNGKVKLDADSRYNDLKIL